MNVRYWCIGRNVCHWDSYFTEKEVESMGWEMYSKGDIYAIHLRFLSMSGVHVRI